MQSYAYSFVSASHRAPCMLLIYLSITSPGSHVPQHRWSQHHVSRLALMLALMRLAVANRSLSHIHALRKRSTVCPVKARSTLQVAQDNPWMVQIHGLRRTHIPDPLSIINAATSSSIARYLGVNSSRRIIFQKALLW